EQFSAALLSRSISHQPGQGGLFDGAGRVHRQRLAPVWRLAGGQTRRRALAVGVAVCHQRTLRARRAIAGVETDGGVASCGYGLFGFGQRRGLSTRAAAFSETDRRGDWCRRRYRWSRRLLVAELARVDQTGDWLI